MREAGHGESNTSMGTPSIYLSYPDADDNTNCAQGAFTTEALKWYFSSLGSDGHVLWECGGHARLSVANVYSQSQSCLRQVGMAGDPLTNDFIAAWGDFRNGGGHSEVYAATIGN